MDEDGQSFTPERQGGPVVKQQAGNRVTWAVPTDPRDLDSSPFCPFFSCLGFCVVKAGISGVVLILAYGNQRLFRTQSLRSPKSHFLNKHTEAQPQLESRFPGSFKGSPQCFKLHCEDTFLTQRQIAMLQVPAATAILGVKSKVAGTPRLLLVASTPASREVTTSRVPVLPPIPPPHQPPPPPARGRA